MKTKAATAPIDGTYPGRIEYQYTLATLRAAHKIPKGCVNEQSHQIGIRQGEPLIVMLDCLLQYASVHKARFGSPLAQDYVLGVAWIKAARAVKDLLDGDGVVASMLSRTTDSKDNGACDRVYAEACEVAGFSYEGDVLEATCS